MNILLKQMRSDLYELVKMSISLLLVVPLMFFMFSLGNSNFSSAREYINLMAMFALPMGFLSFTMSRVSIKINTCIGMGSTRRNFYISNLITTPIFAVLCTMAALAISSVITLIRGNVNTMLEMLRMSVSLNTIITAACTSLLAVGAGSLLGALMVRFGRKIFIMTIIMLMIGGGFAGGFIAATEGGRVIQLPGVNWKAIILSILAVLGVVLYGVSYIPIKKHYVS